MQSEKVNTSTEKQVEYDLVRPWRTLDRWQKDYIRTEPNQNCFLLTGRQVGKTTAMSIKAVELCIHYFKEGENILIVSVTEKQAYIMLSKALAYAQVRYSARLATGKDKPTMHSITFKNGTKILCYAAGETGQGLRGYTIKKLMIDEGARMKPEFFTAVTPMLSVVKGSMDISSTPCGKEGFFYERSTDNAFKKFYVSAEDCPRHTKAFLDMEKSRMTRLEYAQEYLAMFLDELKRFFSHELIKKVMTLEKKPVHSSAGTHYMGADIARLGSDETVLISMNRINEEELIMCDMDVIVKTYTTDVVDRILYLDAKYNYRKIYIDDGGLGVAVFDPLLRNSQTKRKVEAINNAARSLTQDKSKRKKLLKEDLYNNLKRLMEQGKIHLWKDEELAQSLSSVQYEYTDTGQMRIFGKDTHKTEALIRAAWAVMDDKRGLWVFTGSLGLQS